ncbi:MAG: FAD-dependent oxidoreductase [Hyphomonadaceae bacterium]
MTLTSSPSAPNDPIEHEGLADLAIVGAGPIGATLAIAAAQAGFTVTLIDARDPDSVRPDGRNYAIVRGSWHLLTGCGVTGELRDTAQPLNGLEAIDGGRHWFGAPSVLFTDEDLPDAPDGTPLGYMVEAPRLQAALDRKLAAEDNIQWLQRAEFTGFTSESGRISLHLAGGNTCHARLVAGCDGVRSPVRQAAKITVEGREYGKSVFAANVRLTRPHHGIARQLFTPEGPFATLPLTGDRANLAWYMDTSAAKTLAAMSAEDIEAELNAKFAEFAGEMSLEGKAISYPLELKIADSMVAERVALVGDAARRVNPLAGQGLNLGFKDVAALVEVLEDGRHAGLDIGALNVLDPYQQWRRFDAAATALGLDAIDRLFSNDNALLKPLRGAGLMLANRVPLVREALARQASAQQANLPKRMQPPAS